MIRKVLLPLSGLLVLAAVPASSAYASSAPHTLSPLSQRPQISSIPEICAQAGTGYCLNDWNAAGSGGAVKMENTGYANNSFAEYKLSGYCDDGYVTDGVHSPGPACPFPNGSGLNSKYEGYPIIAALSGVSGACIGTDGSGKANLGACPPSSGGSGSNIWVVGGPICGNSSYYLINVYWSARHGTSGASSLISGGSIGAQAYVAMNNPQASCWRYQYS
jgi:hypothetical protein